MKIAKRNFLIPEDTNEIALLQGAKGMKSIPVACGDVIYMYIQKMIVMNF